MTRIKSGRSVLCPFIVSQPIGIYGFKGSTLYIIYKSNTLVGIILVITQNLLDMDDL